MWNGLNKLLLPVLQSANMSTQRPILRRNFASNVDGLYIIGDLAGAPVVKLAMEQGNDVAEHIVAQLDAKSADPRGDPNIYDLVVIGAGAAGLNAALTAQDHGLKVLVLEKNKIANTIEDFPEGKWVYAEPDTRPPKGKLWLDGARKEELISRWHEIITENHLEVRVDEGVETLRKRSDGGFDLSTDGAWEKIGKPHGDIACFSFHPRKVITTGDGGMLTTANPEWDRQFRLWRQHGMSASDWNM